MAAVPASNSAADATGQPHAGRLAPGGGQTAPAMATCTCANTSEANTVASTHSKTTMAHQEWEALPRAPTGKNTPSATSATSACGTLSDCHNHTTMATMAVTPQANAMATQPTVNNRKKPAVPAAARSGHQLSPGSTSRWRGTASRQLVTSVSRPPEWVPGKK